MENESYFKEVRFDVYCQICKHSGAKEDDSPCCVCLATPANINSHKPIKWEEKE